MSGDSITRIHWAYVYPDDSCPDVRRVKQLAARVGRTLGKQDQHERACLALKRGLSKLDSGTLRYWACVVMIDPRWCGATGHGGFWAAASHMVNELALELLAERGREWRALYGDAVFVVDS